MRLGTSGQTRKSLGKVRWLTAILLAGGLLLGAAPAVAGGDGDFEDGLEDELGRMTAREIFRFGHFILGGVLQPQYNAYPSYHDPYPAYGHAPRPYRRPPAWRPHRPAYYPPAQRPPAYAHPPCPISGHGEHTVYERYERTVNAPPPQQRPVGYYPAGY